MINCDVKECGSKAEFISFWPGQEIKVCKRHLDQQAAMADVMGFKLGWVSVKPEASETDVK